MKTVAILIAAYNEENNILNLLDDITRQTLSDGLSSFRIDKIIVASDCSSDNTDERVIEYAKNKDSRVELIRNVSRSGKMITLLDVFKNLDTDIVINFDADVRLASDCIPTLLSSWNSDGYALAGGDPIPKLSRFYFLSFAESASYFSWRLLREIKKFRPSSVYSAHGRILGLSKNLYKNLEAYREIKAGTDRAMYAAARGSFRYISAAKVFYKCPMTAKDYLKQARRYQNAQSGLNKSMENLPAQEKMLAFFLATIKAPYSGLCWLIMQLVSFFSKKNQQSSGPLWEAVSSTK